MATTNNISNTASVFNSDSTISVGTDLESTGGDIIASAGNLRCAQLTFDSTYYIDFYETGTFTVSLTFGGGSTGLAFTQSTSYQRFADIVFIRASILLSNKGTSTGLALFSGLPYTVANTTGNMCCSWSNITNGSININGVFLGGTTTYRVDQVGSATGSQQLTDVAFANNTFIVMTGFYYV